MSTARMARNQQVCKDRDDEIPDDGQIQLRNLREISVPWKIQGNFAARSAAVADSQQLVEELETITSPAATKNRAPGPEGEKATHVIAANGDSGAS